MPFDKKQVLLYKCWQVQYITEFMVFPPHRHGKGVMIWPGISPVKHEWMQWLFLPYFPAFLELVRANNSDLGRRQRRAFRQLLKQTVEFIVPHKYQYQNQYSCRPPPLFMMTISPLQAVVFIYNSVIFYRETQVFGHCNAKFSIWPSVPCIVKLFSSGRYKSKCAS